MFDFGFSELLLIGAVALVVLGPERLPAAARMAGQFAGKIQRLISGVKQELGAQIELEALKKAKQQFEETAADVRNSLNEAGSAFQNSARDVSDGLKPWERLPEMRTPADFGKDAHGNPLPDTAAQPESAEPDPWQTYLQTSPYGTGAGTEYAPGGFQTASLRKQAMQRKRDLRPKHRPAPKLRVRKK